MACLCLPLTWLLSPSPCPLTGRLPTQPSTNKRRRSEFDVAGPLGGGQGERSVQLCSERVDLGEPATFKPLFAHLILLPCCCIQSSRLPLCVLCCTFGTWPITASLTAPAPAPLILPGAAVLVSSPSGVAPEGVARMGSRWRARLSLDLGTFETEAEAKKAHNR